MQSPRIWDERGKFIALPEKIERQLEASDPNKHSRYVALRAAAIANQDAESAVDGLKRAIAKKTIELREAIRARDKAHPKRTFLQEWAQNKSRDR